MLKKRYIYIAIVFVFTITLFSGCCFTKGVVKFDALQYPTSMSAFLYDNNRNVVMKGRDLESLYSFKFKRNYWSLVYGLVQFKQKETICDSLNAVVNKYKGDGIINLTITVDHGIVDKISAIFMYIPHYIPILPSSAKVTISGEVVKLNRRDVSLIYDQNFISKRDINQRLNDKFNEID